MRPRLEVPRSYLLALRTKPLAEASAVKLSQGGRQCCNFSEKLPAAFQGSDIEDEVLAVIVSSFGFRVLSEATDEDDYKHPLRPVTTL